MSEAGTANRAPRTSARATATPGIAFASRSYGFFALRFSAILPKTSPTVSTTVAGPFLIGSTRTPSLLTRGAVSSGPHCLQSRFPFWPSGSGPLYTDSFPVWSFCGLIPRTTNWTCGPQRRALRVSKSETCSWYGSFADHLDAIPTLARWHPAEWLYIAPEVTKSDRADHLRGWSRRNADGMDDLPGCRMLTSF